MSEIEFPSQASELTQHSPVTVALFQLVAQAEKPVLAGRTTTTHLRPNGAIVQVRPQFKRPWPLKMSDEVKARFSKSATAQPLLADARVSWVRERAFMPSGLAVTLVGITFDWDAAEMALEVAAFLAS